MLDVGGGGGGTPWESYSMELMHELIQNPDIDKHYQIVDGWQKSYELIGSHRFQVESYRDNLAAAWPPEKSAAARAYNDRLNTLIESLNETYDAAVANHDAFASATLSLSLAKKDFQKLFDEYQSNERTLADFQAKQADAPSGPTPSPSPSGEQPPVAPGRQEQLKQQAVTLLSGVSTELAQAQLRIRTPAPYKEIYRKGDPESKSGDGFVAPPIPPIRPVTASQAEATARSRRSTIAFPTSVGSGVHGPLPPATAAVGDQPSLVLGGATPPVVPPPPPIGPPPPPQLGSGGGLQPSPGIVSPIVNPLVSGGTTGLPPPVGSNGRAGVMPHGGPIRPGASSGGVVRAMPPGGVIGGTPGVGSAQPRMTQPGSRRINPVGGVIGVSDTPETARGRGLAGAGERAGMAGQPYGQTGARGGRRRDETNNRWDPDNPWETIEGVDPVVLPSREQRIDPGPAIGLH